MKDFTIQISFEFDDITMKTELVVRQDILAIRFHENSFFSTIHGFIPHWNYKNSVKYICQKIVNSSTANKIHLKSDVFNGSIVNG